MKKLSILFLSAVALTTTFTSCSKDEDKPADTALELTIIDGNNSGAALEKVAVYLYDSAEATEPIKTGESGNDGKIKFSGLKSQLYYIVAVTDETAGCKSNEFTTVDTGDSPIAAGKTTSLNVPVLSGAVLKLTNTTTSNYLISVKFGSGAYQNLAIMTGKDSDSDPNKTGSKTFLSGSYLMKLTPVDDAGTPISGGTVISDIPVQVDPCGTFEYTIQ